MQLTFLFLVQLDTIDRLENIIAVTSYLSKNKDAIYNVFECGPFNNGLLKKLLDKNIRYTFHKDNDPILYRTKFLNQMTLKVETPFVAVWDADVIIAPSQVLQALALLKSGEADFVIPYEKQALDTTPIIRKLFLEDGKIETLEQNKKRMKEMYAPNPLGGAFMANLESYKKVGMENEDFYGWGLEDGERYYRWQKLGYKIKRVPGPLFHLSHGRGINSMFHHPDQELIKRRETLKAKRLADNSLNS